MTKLEELVRQYLETREAYRLCKTCIGLSPPWDGHQARPKPCMGKALELLQEELDRLEESREAEAQRRVEQFIVRQNNYNGTYIAAHKDDPHNDIGFGGTASEAITNAERYLSRQQRGVV